MLVLAMEFSRGAQRGTRDARHHKDQTDDEVQVHGRAAGDDQNGHGGIASEGGFTPDCLIGKVRGSLPQNGIVIAHCHR
jgi:hypothetical protein